MSPLKAALCSLTISMGPGLWSSGNATVLAGQINGDPVSATSPDKKHIASLTITPITHLDGPNAAEQALLAGIGYKRWTFNYGGGAGTGMFNVLQYGAFALNPVGGANISVSYDDGVAAPRTDYNWVQFAYPHNWGAADNTDVVDSTPPSNKNSPFYDSLTAATLSDRLTPLGLVGSGAIWLDQKNYPQQHIQNPAGGGKVPAGDLLLVDQPFCSWTCIKPNEVSMDNFDTYLVTFTPPKKKQPGTVTFLDGFHWGVKIECAPPPPKEAPCRCQCGFPVEEPRLSGLFAVASLSLLTLVKVQRRRADVM